MCSSDGKSSSDGELAEELMIQIIQAFRMRRNDVNDKKGWPRERARVQVSKNRSEMEQTRQSREESLRDNEGLR